MNEFDATVSSAELITLQSELVSLADQMHELYELMNSDVSSLGEAWRDQKYDEFLTGYKPQMDKMEEISERYREWATKDLQVTIDHVIDAEGVDVSGDSVGGAGFSSGSEESSSSSTSSGNPFLAGKKGPSSSERPHGPQIDYFGRNNKYDPSKLERPRGPQGLDPALQKKWHDDHTERGAREREYPHEGIIKESEEKQQKIEMKKRDNNMFGYLMNKDKSR